MADLEKLIQSKTVFIPDELKQFQKIFKHFKGKKVGSLEGDDRPLLNSPKDFYLKSPTEDGFLQGDILKGLNPVGIDHEGDAFQSENLDLAMVLSNECDTEFRKNHQDHIRFCPIYSFDELVQGIDGTPEDISSFKGNLKANYFSEYYWMPKIDSSPMVADLGHIYSADLKWTHERLTEGKIQRVVSLSDDAYYLLKIKLAWFFLRPLPDSKRSELENF